MSHDVLDQLRGENPVPGEVPTVPLETMMRRLDEAPPAEISRSRAARVRARGLRSPNRRLAAVLPILSVAVVIAIAGTVLLSVKSHTARPTAVPSTAPVTPGGSGLALSAGEYAFAVGGDVSPRPSRTQASSGLLLFRADQVLRERCMRQRGFRYIPAGTPTTSALPATTGYPSTFYPQPMISAYPEAVLLAFRQRHGFGLSTSAGASHTDPDRNDRYLKTLSSARQQQWRNAWMGHHGCYGLAQAELFGSQRAATLEQQVPVQIYNYLTSTVYTPDGAISAANPSTAAAAAAWSRCMRTATGHTWPDEDALISSLTNDQTLTQSQSQSQSRLRFQLAAAETNLAVTGARCAYGTGQAQAFAAAFHHAATHLPAALATELRYLLDQRNAWIASAQTILASSSP
jgi:hypothetical protein